jgi:predicted Zn-dependent peptidase
MKKIILLIFSGLGLSAAFTQKSVATSFMVDGIKVLYKPTSKEIISVSVYFRGGVTNYSKEKAGIERLAVLGASECGTQKYSPNQFKDRSDLYGIVLGGSAGLDNARIGLNCIAKYFEEGWELFTEAVLHPVYNDNAFEKMKQKLISASRNVESNPDGRLRSLAMQTAFSGTPYATDPNGSDSSLSPISGQEVKEYYLNSLAKSRIFIVVVGNISQETITARIHEAFASIPATPYQAGVVDPPLFDRNSVNIEDRSMSTNYIMGIMNAPSYTSPDYFPFQLAITELHGMLFSEIRLKRSLSYAPDATLYSARFPYATVYVSTTNPKEAVQVITDVINGMKKSSVARKSLTEIKALYITAFFQKEESTDAMAESLGRSEILGDWSMSEHMPDIISRTTRSEMAKAFSKYIKGIRWTYLGDRKKADEAMPSFNISVE